MKPKTVYMTKRELKRSRERRERRRKDRQQKRTDRLYIGLWVIGLAGFMVLAYFSLGNYVLEGRL